MVHNVVMPLKITLQPLIVQPKQVLYNFGLHSRHRLWESFVVPVPDDWAKNPRKPQEKIPDTMGEYSCGLGVARSQKGCAPKMLTTAVRPGPDMST